MPLPPAPTQRASLLANKNIPRSEKTSTPPLTSARPQAPAKKTNTKKSAAEQSGYLTDNEPVATPTHISTDSPVASKDTRVALPVIAKKPKPVKKHNGPTKLFVLDTNVLMHDPMCLFQFEEHDILAHDCFGRVRQSQKRHDRGGSKCQTNQPLARCLSSCA